MAARARLTVLFSAVCIIASFASRDEIWEIVIRAKASDSSRLYVLHDFNSGGSATYRDGVFEPFPARQTSDMMLKTMGFLREGVNWPGVHLGNLFRRPKATALFLVDGLSADIGMTPLSDRSFPVDQSQLSGEVTDDAMNMFTGDNVLQHFQRVFDGRSRVMAISGDQKINSLLLPLSGEEPLEAASVDTIDGLPENVLDASAPVDAQFMKEIGLIRNQLDSLSSSSISDGAPDVYVFTFPSLEGLRKKYGAQSRQLEVAAELVATTIKMGNNHLVQLYDGEVIVQALVLQWEYAEMSEEQQQTFKNILEQHKVPVDSFHQIMSDIPKISVPSDMDDETKSSLFSEVSEMVSATSEGSYVKAPEHRLKKRSVHARQDAPPVLEGVVEDRSENFPAIFLMVFVTIVPAGLALFAISWTMWTMDPGRDSVIYRVTDPAGLKMES